MHPGNLSSNMIFYSLNSGIILTWISSPLLVSQDKRSGSIHWRSARARRTQV